MLPYCGLETTTARDIWKHGVQPDLAKDRFVDGRPSHSPLSVHYGMGEGLHSVDIGSHGAAIAALVNGNVYSF